MLHKLHCCYSDTGFNLETLLLSSVHTCECQECGLHCGPLPLLWGFPRPSLASLFPPTLPVLITGQTDLGCNARLLFLPTLGLALPPLWQPHSTAIWDTAGCSVCLLDLSRNFLAKANSAFPSSSNSLTQPHAALSRDSNLFLPPAWIANAYVDVGRGLTGSWGPR